MVGGVVLLYIVQVFSLVLGVGFCRSFLYFSVLTSYFFLFDTVKCNCIHVHSFFFVIHDFGFRFSFKDICFLLRIWRYPSYIYIYIYIYIYMYIYMKVNME